MRAIPESKRDRAEDSHACQCCDRPAIVLLEIQVTRQRRMLVCLRCMPPSPEQEQGR